MNSTPCRNVPLADNAPFHVERCRDCGCVSIRAGAFTLRVDDDGLEELWVCIGTACAKLQELRLEERGPGALAKGDG